MKSATIVVSQGSPMPMAMQVITVILGLFGIMFPPLALVCVVALAYRGGVELDPAQQRFREYGSIFGLRRGKWRPMTSFTSLTILRVDRTGTQYGRSGNGVDTHERNFDVCLLSADHRKKAIIHSSNEREKAFALARSLSSSLGMEVVTYAPVLSSAGRRR